MLICLLNGTLLVYRCCPISSVVGAPKDQITLVVDMLPMLTVAVIKVEVSTLLPSPIPKHFLKLVQIIKPVIMVAIETNKIEVPEMHEGVVGEG